MPGMNAILERAEQCLVINFIAHIGLWMAPLGKAGVLHMRHTTKPWNEAIAGYSEFSASPIGAKALTAR
jgi:hypothetical protein